MKSLPMLVLALVGLLFVRPGAASAQTCQICQGPVPMRVCASTYQSGYNDCVSDGTSCNLNGGSCAGGKTFFSPDGSTRRVESVVAVSSPAGAIPLPAAAKKQPVAGGFLLVDYKQRVVGRSR